MSIFQMRSDVFTERNRSFFNTKSFQILISTCMILVVLYSYTEFIEKDMIGNELTNLAVLFLLFFSILMYGTKCVSGSLYPIVSVKLLSMSRGSGWIDYGMLLSGVAMLFLTYTPDGSTSFLIESCLLIVLSEVALLSSISEFKLARTLVQQLELAHSGVSGVPSVEGYSSAEIEELLFLCEQDRFDEAVIKAIYGRFS